MDPSSLGVYQPEELMAVDADEQQVRRERAVFRELAAALAEEQDLDFILRLIVDRLSALTGAERCSLHLLDTESGLFYGRAAHASIDIDRKVRRLVSGIPGDDFTREIIETRSPVLLTNTLADPRPIQAAMLRWRVRSVLGIPMVLRDQVIGILCLDTEDTAMQFSRRDVDLATTLSALGGTAINQVQLTTALRHSVQLQAKQLGILQRIRHTESRLADVVLSGSGPRELVASVAESLKKACGIYDTNLRRYIHNDAYVAVSRGHVLPASLDRHPAAGQILAESATAGFVILKPAPTAGIPDRLLVAPIELEDEHFGYVVVSEAGGRFGSVDQTIVRRAARSVELQRSRSRLDAEMEWHMVEVLTGYLIRGEIEKSDPLAESLGVDWSDDRVVCVVAPRDQARELEVTSREIARSLNASHPPRATLAARVDDQIVAIMGIPADLAQPEAVDAWVREHVQEALTCVSADHELCVAIAAAGTGIRYEQRAYREANQVMRCIREHVPASAQGVLSVNELGAARLMLASSTRKDANQFAQDILGGLFLESSAKKEDLLVTLESYLRRARNVRATADELGVHPNTIRYRLSTIERITSLDITTDDQDYLTAQMAMTIIRLRGE